ncbi:hypothetical protein COT48_00285 [Candidatus Woesearchaeota archaeon CG08_land_8_20_14_0_20_47_9]|nr:MAG: hypothetical protein AUJ69_01505 [Candidatus Woesearchaeota archaeon CG1_02_47_18]PIN76626.1 MAG: hypothetical protein COV22_00130 [Candidatus Woesearchaeota archaeon CG10_big_fil_rev_8_21_14_0_10_47_5]PIO04457.1 MAG: hypothetical protein COT48_00285 [Candidatus Woesearchaeota archaeon CG08_land_8_20_14_0_20_47_9]HII30325.1 hypothetical protein [Candidatus Woesearchaeota archaeon]
MPTKRSNRLALALYFLLVIFLAAMVGLYVFSIMPIKGDKFAVFLISLLFAALILPVVSSIKFFDLIELHKDIRIMRLETEKQLKEIKAAQMQVLNAYGKQKAMLEKELKR